MADGKFDNISVQRQLNAVLNYILMGQECLYDAIVAHALLRHYLNAVHGLEKTKINFEDPKESDKDLSDSEASAIISHQKTLDLLLSLSETSYAERLDSYRKIMTPEPLSATRPEEEVP